MTATQSETANYINAFCRELAVQARRADLDTAAYLLEIVVAETSKVAQQRTAAKKLAS